MPIRFEYPILHLYWLVFFKIITLRNALASFCFVYHYSWNTPWRWCVFLPDVTSLCWWLSHGDNVPFPVSCEFSTAVVCGSFKRGQNYWSNRFDMAELAGLPRLWSLSRSLSHDETYETTSASGSDSSCSAMTGATLEKNCVLAQTPKKRLRCSFCGHSTPMCDSGMFWAVACWSKSRSLPSVCFDTFFWCDFYSYMLGHSNKILPVCLM